MLERTFHSYQLRPKAYPFKGYINLEKARSVRKVKLQWEYTGIDFSQDYCSPYSPLSTNQVVLSNSTDPDERAPLGALSSGQLYPSSKWASENRNQYDGKRPDRSHTKPDFVITSLDTRKHKPQTTQIFHIKRINKKPVCSVQASFEAGKFADEVRDEPSTSVYAVSYTGQEKGDNHLHRMEKPAAEGIVPINDRTDHFDVRAEMMLPVCDSTVIPSAHNPHRYLLRKRKVPPPYRILPKTDPVTHGCGIVYPNLEKPRMVAFHPDQIPTGDLPFVNEQITEIPPPPPSAQQHRGQQERISVSSLAGQDFSRRKCIHPPQGHIAVEYLVPRPPSPVCVSSLAGKKFTRRRELQPHDCEINMGFDGGVGPTSSVRFDDRYLPFIRAKTII